ncbi:TrkH family potassium uptake protein [Litorimonas sp. RW-G-Af-16]|uniref:TrkH family potassium uptake protein n=1 Tax=Litorimonas sp. RW-G-Af-16 TaxID=3241168 RepID=UPI00390CA9E5
MAITRIILWLGNSFVFCAALFAITAITAFVSLDITGATRMAFLTFIAGVIGAVLIAMTFNTSSRETNVEAIIFLFLFWLTVPLLTALPFVVLEGSPTYFAAYFEAVSAFTTTGASQIDADLQRPALLFWRSLLQWFGGVCSATFAVVILAALNLTGTGVHRSMLFTRKKGELFARLLSIGRLVAGIYLFLSTIGFIFMVIGGTPAFDAICLSLSGISTGGLAPRTGALSLYLSPFSAMILAVLCALGALNIAVIWDLMRGRRWIDVVRLFGNIEHRGWMVITGLLILLSVLYIGPQFLFGLIVDSIYFTSSAGFQYDVLSIDLLPPVVLVCLALIGGSALSTAGGVKVIRILLLLRHLGTDLSRLSHPSRILPVTFKSSVIPDRAFLSIWMYFFGYTLCFGLGIAAFGAVGLGLEDAMTVSAATLSNMGPLLPLTLPESGLTYASFTPLQMAVACALMLLGRVEILAAIVLFTPTFWRNT